MGDGLKRAAAAARATQVKSKAEYALELKAAAKEKAKPPPEPPEHLEDRAAREEDERYAAAHSAQFCTEFAGAFLGLIATYPDGDAHAKLDDLRERFWAQLWRPPPPPGGT